MRQLLNYLGLVGLLMLFGCGSRSANETPGSDAQALRVTERVLTLTQTQHDTTLVTSLSTTGARVTDYPGGIGGLPAHGGIVRYADESVVSLNFANHTFARQNLDQLLEGRRASEQQVRTTLDAQGIGADAGLGRLERTGLVTKIHGIEAHAFMVLEGDSPRRVWYAEGVPLPPGHLRNALADVECQQGTNSKPPRACDDDEIRREVAGKPLLRLELAQNGKWVTILDTVSAEWRLASDTLDIPAGFIDAAPAALTLTASGTAAPVQASLVSFGNFVMHQPELHLFFWGTKFGDGAHDAAVTQLTSAFAEAVSPEGSSWVREYGVLPGVVADAKVIPLPPPSVIGEDTKVSNPVVSELALSAMLESGPLFWWKSGPDPLVMIIVNADDVATSRISGFHTVTASPVGLLPFPVDLMVNPLMPVALVKVPGLALDVAPGALRHRDERHGIQEPCTLGTTRPCDAVGAFDHGTVTASHEIFEAATDPYPGLGYIDFSKPMEQSEVCDICEHQQSDEWWRVGDFVLATAWSNVTNACMGPHLPAIAITKPAADEVFQWHSGMSVVAEATASGTIDRGSKLDDDITWSLDGSVIGHGSSVNRVMWSGRHHLVVELTDANGVTATDDRWFTAEATPSTAAIDDPADGTTVAVGQVISLRGHGTTAYEPYSASDGYISWYAGATLLGTGHVLPVSFSDPGDVDLSLVVGTIDSAATERRTLHVVPSNGSPSVAIVSELMGWGVLEETNDCTTLIDWRCEFSGHLTAVARDAAGNPLPGSAVHWTAVPINTVPFGTIPFDSLDLGTGLDITPTLYGYQCVISAYTVTATVTTPDGRTSSDSITLYVTGNGC